MLMMQEKFLEEILFKLFLPTKLIKSPINDGNDSLILSLKE
jgi:hypothetical protein